MGMTFDGPTRRVNLTPGTVQLDVRDMLSRWADWVTESDNSKYLPAFDQAGGNEISAGTSVPIYAFLLNAWRIKPQESNHTLNLGGGVLVVQGGGDPFVNTDAAFVIRINYQQPVQAITVSTGGSGLNLQQIEESQILAKEATVLIAVQKASTAAALSA
jgi:hypothetical protein